MEIMTKSSTVNGIKWHWAEAGDGDPVVPVSYTHLRAHET